MGDRLEHFITASIFDLMDSTLFYVPEILVDTFSPEEKEAWAPHVNQLMLVDGNGFNFIVEKDDVAIQVMKKFNKLSEVVFSLYNLKDQFGESAFQYAVEKYGGLVALFHYVTDWMDNNCQKDIVSLTENHKKAFTLQRQLHLEHKLDFEKRFALPKIEIGATSPIVESVKKSFGGLAPNPNTGAATGTKDHQTKKERLQLIKQDTEIIAEKYLLSTVFGVKFDK